MKKKITLIGIVMLIIMSLVTSVQAYQATSKGVSESNMPATWANGIRKMEGAGGGLGLTETIDDTTLIATTDSNNIDVHLLKNTEYGAILLLGASDYGKQGASIEARRMDRGANLTNLTGVQAASTTGNRYGVYEMGYYFDTSGAIQSGYEWVAGGLDTFLPDVAPRYIDRYTDSTDSAKDGDATVETDMWHGSTVGTWVNSNNPGFGRGSNGAFFFHIWTTGYPLYARAGVVVNTGL